MPDITEVLHLVLQVIQSGKNMHLESCLHANIHMLRTPIKFKSKIKIKNVYSCYEWVGEKQRLIFLLKLSHHLDICKSFTYHTDMQSFFKHPLFKNVFPLNKCEQQRLSIYFYGKTTNFHFL